MGVLQKYDCGIHDLTYRRVHPGCPACALERQLEKANKDLDEATGLIAEMRGTTQKVLAASALDYSIGNASDLLDANDRAFLKATLYRWREHKDVDLGLTEDARGFTTNEETHECTSVGGLAIAGFFQEAMMAYGRPVALGLLQRGMAKHMKGT